MENLEGQKVGEWEILIDRIRIEGNKKHQYAWARCSCGIYRLIDRHDIYNSCGHVRKAKDGVKHHIPIDFENYYKGHSLNECANNYQVSNWIIWQWAKSIDLAKILMRGLTISQEFTEKQVDIIIGSLLGDASLKKIYDNRNSCFNLKHGECQLEYLKWIHAELLPYSYKINKGEASENTIRQLATYGGLCTELTFYQFSTVHISFFTELEHKWYLRDENNNYIFNDLGWRIKIIPKDLFLNPLRLAVWFYDDGNNRPSKREAYFATQCFTEEECLFLIDRLKELNINSTLNKGDGVIRISSSSYIDFIDIIKDQLPIQSMQYKISLDKYKKPNYTTRFQPGRNAKLNKEKIMQIFDLDKQGMIQKEISVITNISTTTISYLLSGKTWQEFQQFNPRLTTIPS